MTNRLAKLTVLALSSAVVLTGCGSNKDDNSSSDASSQAATSAASAESKSTADPASFKPACPAGTLNGAGSSAQANAINQVIQDYAAACPKTKINYTPSGSGAGIESFIGKQVDFAGSDSALNPDKGEVDKAKATCGADAWHLPLAAGPIAVVYNVDGVSKLNLKTETLAKIFAGQIKKWDDDAIKADNPDAKLPSENISVYYRADKSGTTDNFTKFLNKAAGDVWTAKHSKEWKGTGKGADKSAGVTQAVKDNKNSISYTEWSYATKNNLNMAAIDNGNGPVELTGESAGKAVSAAKTAGEGNDLQLEMQYKNTPKDVYPAVLVTYEIACSSGNKNADVLKDFLSFYASQDEQKKIQDLGYAPLPTDVSKKALDSAQAIS